MNRKEQKYQHLIQSLSYYGNEERFSIDWIQKKEKVGFPWAQQFHERLRKEAWIDEEDHKIDGSFPCGLCLNDLKRSKRYCGKSFPYPLPLGESATGERKAYALNEIGSLFLLADDGAGKMNALRVILTSLVIGGSRTKPDFLLIDTKRVQLDPYASFLHRIAPILKEEEEISDTLKNLIEEKKTRKTPLVVIINEVDDLLEKSNQFSGLVQTLAAPGKSKNISLIALTQRNEPTLNTPELKKAFTSRMELHYGGKEATLYPSEEELVVPTLGETECLAYLKALKEKRTKK